MLESSLAFFTEEEKNGIAELAQTLSRRTAEISRAKPGWATQEQFYIRWLRARNLNVPSAAQMLEHHLEWRASMGVDKIATLSADEVLGCSADLIDQHIPKWVRGRDRAGRPIQWTQWANVDVDAALEATTIERYLDYHVWKWVHMEHALGAATRDAKRYVGKIVVVVDLDGMRLGQCTRAFYHMVRGIASIDGDNYPERLGQCLIVNAPRVFAVVWSGVSRFIDPATQRKLRILNSSGKSIVEQLSEVIDRSQIPQDYGGDAPPLSPGTWNDFATLAKGSSGGGGSSDATLATPPSLSPSQDASTSPTHPHHTHHHGQHHHPHHISDLEMSQDSSQIFYSCDDVEDSSMLELEQSVDSTMQGLGSGVGALNASSDGDGDGITVRDDAAAAASAKQRWRRWAMRFVDDFEEEKSENSRTFDPLGRMEKVGQFICCDMCGIVRMKCCSLRCASILLHASNAIWMLLGGFLVALGFYVRFSFLWTGDLIDWGLWEPLVIIFVGTAVIAIALVGSVGACRSSRLLLTVFAMANVVICFILVCFGIAVLVRLAAADKAISGTLSAPSAPTSLSQDELKIIATENSFLLSIVALSISTFVLLPTGAGLALRFHAPTAGGAGLEATTQSKLELKRLAVLALIFNSSHFIFGLIALGYSFYMIYIGVTHYSSYLLLCTGLLLEVVALAGISVWCWAAHRYRRFTAILVVYAVLLIFAIVVLVLFSGSAFAQIRYMDSASENSNEADGMKEGLVVGATLCFVCSALLGVSLISVLYTLFVSMRRSQLRYAQLVASMSDGRVSVRAVDYGDGRRTFQAHFGSDSDDDFPVPVRETPA